MEMMAQSGLTDKLKLSLIKQNRINHKNRKKIDAYYTGSITTSNSIQV